MSIRVDRDVLSQFLAAASDEFLHDATVRNRPTRIVVRTVQSLPAMLEEYLPADLQVKATLHFTPSPLARHIAKILAPHPGTRVLDVGSGAGLFCVAAALVAPRAEFVGVEWRSRLVTIANELAARFDIANARFIQADALDLDWSAFDAFYFFNPFAEHVMESPFVIDRSVPLHPETYESYIIGVQDKLAPLPLGTRVATYHGFGGELPPGYVRVYEEEVGTDRIELWTKVR
jgi:SAM-dependent methyltransferase